MKHWIHLRHNKQSDFLVNLKYLSYKHIVDVCKMVYRIGNGNLYKFNPKKSAVLVYGEKPNEQKRNAKHRSYRLGNDQIKEQTSYDHLGLKTVLT